MRSFLSRTVPATVGVIALSAMIGCSSSSSSTPADDAAPANRDYQATASAGDFIEFSIDADASTYSYDNITTGHSETGTYAVADSDSALTFTASAGTTKLDTGYEVPGLGIVLVANETGSTADKTSIITGFDLVTGKDGRDGYFLMTVTAGDDLASRDLGQDFIFLMDCSGSMANAGKLVLSKQSVAAFVANLGEKDRFDLLTFNATPEPLFGNLRRADAANRGIATEHLNQQRARGSTELGAAMSLAYAYATPDRHLNVVLLSDGVTQPGDRTQLLSAMRNRPQGTTVFAVGVGNQVDKRLLSQMADDTGGVAAFVSQQDDFAHQAEAFRRKLTHAAVRNVQVRIDGVPVDDVIIPEKAQLYHGAPLRIYGRYQAGGDAQITVTGDIDGQTWRCQDTVSFSAKDAGNPELARMWAWHHIDELLRGADRGGSRETVKSEIISLGETFSIVTEFTSFLVLENDGEYDRWQIERRNLARLEGDRAAQARVREQLQALRDRNLAQMQRAVQPAEAAAAPTATRQAPRQAPPVPQITTPAERNNPARTTSPRSSGFGGGAIGRWEILFIAALLFGGTVLAHLRRPIRHDER